MLENSKVVPIGDQTKGFNHGPTDECAAVSVSDALMSVAELEGTSVFYDLFTEWTGIEVGTFGRVGDLEELQCPDFFLNEFCRELWRLYDESKSQQPFEALALASAVIKSPYVAEELVCRHSARLVEAALAQLSSVNVFV